MEKLRAKVEFSWELFSHEDHSFIKNEISNQLKKLNLIDNGVETSVTVISVKKSKKNNRVVVSKHRFEEILPFITEKKCKKTFKIDDKFYDVEMSSDRYNLFRSNSKCVVCGLHGTEMFLELDSPNVKNPHFNLYALEEGKYVLMTKDHIIPKACGGADSINNYQTMCAICNNIKADKDFTNEQVLHLRKYRKKLESENLTKTKASKLYSQEFNRILEKNNYIKLDNLMHELEHEGDVFNSQEIIFMNELGIE